VKAKGINGVTEKRDFLISVEKRDAIKEKHFIALRRLTRRGQGIREGVVLKAHYKNTCISESKKGGNDG